MAKCETCGNDYDKTFTVVMGDRRGVFDSFECAAHAMAPVCAHCGCRILGHGVEDESRIFCCANCARTAGHEQLVDRA
ncbi:hypothetical protein GS894_10600 [Rhodococcus hoagii]|jgi:phage terminase large subunit GpA-like protein|nr:hypothetical protein [Prescottella equi]MBU4614056.1 hypothetical protein [Rhodococcus sp. GG48]GBF15385.1 hypothetical protein Br6_02768 [Rhodococcus sp. Br-6]AVP68761.1 hypothetical protein C7H75_12905 [Prescottella equi]ERN45909.1 hypothetical protein H849_12326 [Prescottella equi NBRC 101255 = C 7]MBM4471341.1 hypothetical protein [Prescottella equi]